MAGTRQKTAPPRRRGRARRRSGKGPHGPRLDRHRHGTAATQNHRTTLVEYGPGNKDRAETVTRSFFPNADLRATPSSGANVILGQEYVGSPAATASGEPAPVPSEVADGARSADDDPCADLSYG